MTKSEKAHHQGHFMLRASCFFRHSCLVIRHSRCEWASVIRRVAPLSARIIFALARAAAVAGAAGDAADFGLGDLYRDSRARECHDRSQSLGVAACSTGGQRPKTIYRGGAAAFTFARPIERGAANKYRRL